MDCLQGPALVSSLAASLSAPQSSALCIPNRPPWRSCAKVLGGWDSWDPCGAAAADNPDPGADRDRVAGGKCDMSSRVRRSESIARSTQRRYNVADIEAISSTATTGYAHLRLDTSYLDAISFSHARLRYMAVALHPTCRSSVRRQQQASPSISVLFAPASHPPGIAGNLVSPTPDTC